MSRLFQVGLVAAVALALVAPAQADSAKASAHFEKGTRLYQVGEYEKALVEFKAGHVEEPDASFLFNIAQCHRLMGQPREAIVFYKRFLSLSPDTPMRADVERKIKDLEDELHRQPVPPAPPPLEARTAPAPDVTAQPPAAIDDSHAVSGSPSRWPVWLGAAVTVGLAGAATAATLTSNARYNELRDGCGRTAQGCSDGQINDIRNRGRVVNVLWGLTGVSAVVTGIAIYATSDGASATVAMRFD
jgi:hypothetical protein